MKKATTATTTRRSRIATTITIINQVFRPATARLLVEVGGETLGGRSSVEENRRHLSAIVSFFALTSNLTRLELSY